MHIADAQRGTMVTAQGNVGCSAEQMQPGLDRCGTRDLAVVMGQGSMSLDANRIPSMGAIAMQIRGGRRVMPQALSKPAPLISQAPVTSFATHQGGGRSSRVLLRAFAFNPSTECLTGAPLDRLPHHINILAMNGDSHHWTQSRTRKAKGIT